MRNQPLFNLDLPLESAERANADWSERALGCLLRYAKEHSRFVINELREVAHGQWGLPAPPYACAWGPVTFRAKKLGLIEKEGVSYRKTEANRTCHSVTVAWRSLVNA